MCNVLWNAKVVDRGEEGMVSGVEIVILSSSRISFRLDSLSRFIKPAGSCECCGRIEGTEFQECSGV